MGTYPHVLLLLPDSLSRLLDALSPHCQLNFAMRFPTLLVVIFASITGRCCGYRPAKIDNLIVFGDSYSDEGRLAYFFAHNNTAPPVGLYIPESNVTASGGKSWPQLASKKLGATTFNYAGKLDPHKQMSRSYLRAFGSAGCIFI